VPAVWAFKARNLRPPDLELARLAREETRMKYKHLTPEQLNRGLIETADALEAEQRFLRSLANGQFRLPKDKDARAGLIASHVKIMEKLQKDYEDLLRALEGNE
jgi:hypothetical protein